MIDPKDIKVNGKQLSEILELHKKWILGQKDGQRAYLQRADLRGAYLRGADLRGAYLQGAYLQGAYLQGADLRGADLQGADLQGADLRGAYLRGADLQGAYLQGADLQRADLRGAYLQGAENIEWADAVTRILPDGDIIGWKKCREGIVKLLIPAKAKRSNATGRKCRAEYAIDKAHFTFAGKKTREDFTSQHNESFVYKVGATIKPDEWDENRWNECSSGVHFFITRFEAEQY
jgi:uncharacterized protein YjbI with pentapeptide repeats